MAWYQSPFVPYFLIVWIAVLTGAILTAYTSLSPSMGFIVFGVLFVILAYLYEHIDIG